MLGRHVIAPGKQVEFDGGEVPLGFQLDRSTPVLRVEVKDQNGEVVYVAEESKEPTPAGRHEIPWKGQLSGPAGGVAPKGLYTFDIYAVDANGISTKVGTTFGYAKVESVSLAGGVTVNTGGLGAVAFAEVERVV
jgi:flagellar hook assembly protein FlgD